jgi:hypothetical protein
MIEPRRELDLSQEPVSTERRGEVRVEDLDGDDTFMFGVLGKEDGSHPSSSELTIYGIGAGERVAEFVGGSRRAGWHWFTAVLRLR